MTRSRVSRLLLAAAAGVVAIALLALAIDRHDSSTSSDRTQAVGTLVAPFDDTTPATAVMAYGDAYLHGTPRAIIGMWSSTCHHPTTSQMSAMAQMRKGAVRVLGPLAKVQVTGAMVRPRTANTVRASPTYNLPIRNVGNSNEIPLVNEHGHWKVLNCTLLPVGGHSQPQGPPADHHVLFLLRGVVDLTPLIDGEVLLQEARDPRTGVCIDPGAIGTSSRGGDDDKAIQVGITIDHANCRLIADLKGT